MKAEGRKQKAEVTPGVLPPPLHVASWMKAESRRQKAEGKARVFPGYFYVVTSAFCLLTSAF